MNWKDVTLELYNKLLEIVKSESDDIDKTLSIALILFGDDVLDLNVHEFNKKIKQLDFLKKDIPNKAVIKKCVLNGTTYNVLSNFNEFTTAQYIDFLNLFKTGELNKFLAPFFIPEGHKYNDGYDLENVMNDILKLDIVSVNSLSFFFKRQYLLFIKIFQYYSILSIKKEKILTKEIKQKMIQMIKDFSNSASFLLY